MNFGCLFGWKVNFYTKYFYCTIFNNYVNFFMYNFCIIDSKALLISNLTSWRLKTIFVFMKRMFWFLKNLLNKLFKSLSNGLCGKCLSLFKYIMIIFFMCIYINSLLYSNQVVFVLIYNSSVFRKAVDQWTRGNKNIPPSIRSQPLRSKMDFQEEGPAILGLLFEIVIIELM